MQQMVLCGTHFIGFYFVSGPEDPYIIFSNRNQLRRYNLKTGVYNILVFNLRNSIALDFDYNNSHIYWTDVADDKIYRGTVDKVSSNAGGWFVVCHEPIFLYVGVTAMLRNLLW